VTAALLGLLCGILVGAVALRAIQFLWDERRRCRRVGPVGLAIGGFITAEHRDHAGVRVIDGFQMTECSFLGEPSVEGKPASAPPPRPRVASGKIKAMDASTESRLRKALETAPSYMSMEDAARELDGNSPPSPGTRRTVNEMRAALCRLREIVAVDERLNEADKRFLAGLESM
jgi:hypothetical protein